MAPFSSNSISPALTGDIYTASILVSCGRGLEDDDGFHLATEVAQAISAQIVGTRAAIDAGWISHDRELGLSGARVSPRLYIGCGVSGTNFHTIGMKHAQHIIAINNDPLARIFTLAHTAVIGDVKPILRALLQDLQSVPHSLTNQQKFPILSNSFLQKLYTKQIN